MAFIERLEKKPRYNYFDVHLWADYFELRCFGDHQLTESDIRKYINPKEDDLDKAVKDDGTSMNPSMNDDEKYELTIQSFFDHYSYRSAHFGQGYPFLFENEILTLKDNLSEIHYSYLYLLACSHLTFFGDFQPEFTSDFEEVSVNFLRTIFPPIEHIYRFGKGRAGAPSRYDGNVEKKITSLAEDLRCNAKSLKFPKQSSGDGGIDIVGWYNPWDSLTSQLIIIAQCKCSDEWSNYRDGKSSVKGVIQLSNDVNNFFFIPFFYRNARGSWHMPQDVDDKILIDRGRLMKSFPTKDFVNLISYTRIKQLLSA